MPVPRGAAGPFPDHGKSFFVKICIPALQNDKRVVYYSLVITFDRKILMWELRV